MEIQATESGVFLPNTTVAQFTRILGKAVRIIEWDSIKEPTISQTADYVGVSVGKIKKDLENIECPLKKSSGGGRGRGKEIKFFKASVEHYKQWL